MADTASSANGETRFWLIRHAIVEENARLVLYGTMDVALCPTALAEQEGVYAALARRLPEPAVWLVTPLQRTRRTAEAIQRAAGRTATLRVEPALTEQGLGEWQGLAHAALPPRLQMKAHAFWPLSAQERPPGGESMADVLARVGTGLERLAAEHAGADVVVVSHGGTIRAAVAHAMGVGPDSALHFSVNNLSLTRLERHPEAWKVVSVNETAWA